MSFLIDFATFTEAEHQVGMFGNKIVYQKTFKANPAISQQDKSTFTINHNISNLDITLSCDIVVKFPDGRSLIIGGGLSSENDNSHIMIWTISTVQILISQTRMYTLSGYDFYVTMRYTKNQ